MISDDIFIKDFAFNVNEILKLSDFEYYEECLCSNIVVYSS